MKPLMLDTPLTLDELQALRPHVDDRTLLGAAVQPGDEGLDFVIGWNYYGWYYAIGRAMAKRRKRDDGIFIAEFGVRYGYSLRAMCLGANKQSHIWPNCAGWDAELDHEGSNAIARRNLKDLEPITGVADLALFRKVRIGDLKVGENPAEGLDIRRQCDIVHVDADHSAEGLKHELALAKTLVRRRSAWIIVDDVKYEPITTILQEQEAAVLLPQSLRVDSLRGTAIYQF